MLKNLNKVISTPIAIFIIIIIAVLAGGIVTWQLKGMRCGKYSRNGVIEVHCAICGDNICEPIERCVSSVVFENMASADCGPLNCPEDCNKDE